MHVVQEMEIKSLMHSISTIFYVDKNKVIFIFEIFSYITIICFGNLYIITIMFYVFCNKCHFKK